MPSKRTDLPRGVFAKGRWYYLVTAAGKKRVWSALSRISEGLPALYTALAAAKVAAAGSERMPALIADWQRDVMPRHAPKTQKDEKARCLVIAEALRDFTPDQVEPPDCSVFLDQFREKPRTFNAYRAQLRELFRYAEERGRRAAGSNPVQSIRTMRTPPRARYITDSELRRLKVAALRWNAGRDDLDTRSGPMLCALIDMAYLTGQSISDVLALEWADIGHAGIRFARSKVAHSTGAALTVEWTPKLEDVVRRLKKLRLDRRAFGGRVFVRQDGQPWSYWGASSAWQRARVRAGITDCTFHDLKAKALTDKEAAAGMQEARKLGQHSTETQTADYIRRRSGERTKATK